MTRSSHIRMKKKKRANKNTKGVTVKGVDNLLVRFARCCNPVPGDEIITFAPFFPEYSVFIENAGAKKVVVNTTPPDFTVDFEALGAALNKNTAAVLINFPNNPTGAVINKDEAKRLGELLREKSDELSKPIYLISDEPYRELSYDAPAPFMPGYYENTIVDYSFSKSLSVPGERIGYIFVPSSAADSSAWFQRHLLLRIRRLLSCPWQ